MKQTLEAYRECIISKDIKLNNLDRDYDILVSRFVDNTPRMVLAEKYDICNGRIRQIEIAHIKRMFHPLFMRYVTKEQHIMDKETLKNILHTMRERK